MAQVDPGGQVDPGARAGQVDPEDRAGLGGPAGPAAPGRTRNLASFRRAGAWTSGNGLGGYFGSSLGNFVRRTVVI